MIYFPMTCNIITMGHIKALELLSLQDSVIVGLLTPKALEGYKKELVSFYEREYILKTIAKGISDNIKIVPQQSLDPTENIIIYECDAIASGDGWQQEELDVIETLNLRRIDFRSGCETHSSDIMKIQ